MRRLSEVVFAIFILLVWGFDASAAQPPCAGWPNGGLNVAGHLQDAAIRAYLDWGYPAAGDDGISGVFFYPDRWTPVSDRETVLGLDGTMTAACELYLTDSDEGVWELRLVADTRLEGVREFPPGTSVPVVLDVVPRLDCSGEGRWQRFRSPSWPISFEYPASWRLGQTDEYMMIGCPDAELIAWGGGTISFKKGQGVEETVGSDGRRATRMGQFSTFDNREWFVGLCDEVPSYTLFCNPARQSRQRGMTVLQGAFGEHRRYRPAAGYVGQGPGIAWYLFVVGDKWIEIQSEYTPEFFDKLDKAGPVIFDGDGVTERVIRSITPR